MLFTMVVKTHGFASPIDLAAYSGLTNNMTCKLMLFNIVAVIRTEFGVFDRYFLCVFWRHIPATTASA